MVLPPAVAEGAGAAPGAAAPVPDSMDTAVTVDALSVEVGYALVALVDEGVDSFPGCHFPGLVLFVDRPLASGVLMLLAESPQPFDSLLGAHGSPEYGRLGCSSNGSPEDRPPTVRA